MGNARKSNFELLRLFAMLGIVILHASSYFLGSYTELCYGG